MQILYCLVHLNLLKHMVFNI